LTAKLSLKAGKTGAYKHVSSAGKPYSALSPPMSKMKTMALDILLARRLPKNSAA
jgi:hypothetical protein